jgi:mannose-6-phosphate isomerase-like protein (cupin superfamily)
MLLVSDSPGDLLKQFETYQAPKIDKWVGVTIRNYKEKKMKISKDSINPFDFQGLEIIDYTAGKDLSSSLAEISVPPGIKHGKAFSTRSDKYYYQVAGHLRFDVEGDLFDLNPGDACLVLKGQKFSYENDSDEPAKLILIHTPSFKLEFEVFEE